MSRLILFFVILSTIVSLNYYSNPPDGYTGAPLNDEYSCSICHQTDENSPYGHSEVVGFPSKLVAGKEYNLEVVIKSDDPGAKYANFQLIVVDKDKSIGKLSKPQQTVKISQYKDREYAESKPAIKIKNELSSFKFNWKAPNTGNNKLITLYYSTIIANGDASFAGDRIIESKAIGVIGNSLDVSIAQQQNNLCPGDSSGFVKLSVNGGQKPYKYQWSNEKTTSEIQNLKSGNYFVTVTDKNGMIGVGNIKIIDPEKLKFSSITKQDVTSNTKGAIDINIVGGSGQYEYTWYKDNVTFSSNQNINNLSEGCYRIEVVDSCKSVIDSTICISDFSSIPKVNLLDHINIFPNPVNDILTINSNSQLLSSYKIIDTNGKVIKSGENKTIDISNLSSGLYYIALDLNHSKVIKKFIVIK